MSLCPGLTPTPCERRTAYGATHHPCDLFFNGAIDDVRIYNRALTQARRSVTQTRPNYSAPVRVLYCLHMRSKVFAFVIAAATIALVGGAVYAQNQTTPDIDAGSQARYQNQQFNFSLNYPADMTVSEDQETAARKPSPSRTRRAASNSRSRSIPYSNGQSRRKRLSDIRPCSDRIRSGRHALRCRRLRGRHCASLVHQEPCHVRNHRAQRRRALASLPPPNLALQLTPRFSPSAPGTNHHDNAAPNLIASSETSTP